MSVTIQLGDESAEIVVVGPIDAGVIKSLAAQADKAVAAGVSEVNLNVAGVTSLDSAGITGLLHVRAGLLDRGMDLHVKGASPEIAATLRLLKVNGLLNLEKDKASR